MIRPSSLPKTPPAPAPAPRLLPARPDTTSDARILHTLIEEEGLSLPEAQTWLADLLAAEQVQLAAASAPPTPEALAIRAQIAASLAHAEAALPASPPPAPPPLAPSGPPPAPRPLAAEAPRLEHVTLADLRDTGRLLQLAAQAQARGLLTGGQAVLTLVTMAEHALRLRARYDPCRLFGALLYDPTKRCRLTDSEEDTARQRLRAWERRQAPVAPPACRPPETPDRPGWSADAAVVAALLVEGPALWGRDPWAWLQTQDPTWTLARWEQAVLEHATRRPRPVAPAVLEREEWWARGGEADEGPPAWEDDDG